MVRGQRLASAVTALAMAGMCAAVLVTVGRTRGAEQELLRRIDDEGSRLIVVRSPDLDHSVDSTTVDLLAGVEGVDWVLGLGPAVDGRNVRLDGGLPVPVRRAFGSIGASALTDPSPLPEPAALATEAAVATSGMEGGLGALVTRDHRDVAVVGRIELPAYLDFLEPAVLVPSPPTEGDTLSVLVIVAENAELVPAISTVATSYYPTEGRASLQVSVADGLARSHRLVREQFGDHGRELVLAVLVVSALTVGANQFGAVNARRRDLGRRRALGASRPFVAVLLSAHVAALSLVGALAGSLVTFVALAAAGDPLPPTGFAGAMVVVAVGTGLIASLPPALYASTRDPLREIRVP